MSYRKKLSSQIAYMALTQKEVAAKIGYSGQGFSNIVSGKTRFMPMETVDKLIDVLKCEASSILGRHDMLRYQEDLTKEQ